MKARFQPPASRRPVRAVASAVAAILVASMVQAPAAAAEEAGFTPPPNRPAPTVPVREVKAAPVPEAARVPVASDRPAPVWPAAGVAEVDVPGPTAASGARTAPVRAGNLPVWVAGANAGRAPDRVRVELLDRVATDRAGVRGVLLRLTPSGAAAGEITVSVDYRAFATAYGADWRSRLRLVALPECALTTPQLRQCSGTPLRSDNDASAATVSAAVPITGGASLLAVSAGASSEDGDYAASPLQASATWSVGGNTGGFNWTYPMRTPPMPGPQPEISLDYSSQSVDGRHSASNNQPSWVGEGFEAWPGGYIERQYLTCSDDMDEEANNDKETGDLCWETSNATLSLNGTSDELIYNAAEDRWHLRSDDGSRITRATGATNGDKDGEYWVLTTTSGTQYWFGLNRLPGWSSGSPVTNSTWTVPVFGNDPDEPCHDSAFADSDCVQGWRWNLDYVVDVHGNSASYWYEKETNKYGRNLDPDDDASYVRGGWLDHLSYGTRTDNGVDSVLGAAAPAQVVFGVADRCLSGCGNKDETHWPDTPWDQECAGDSCTDVLSPTFWTTKRLSTITTQISSGSGYSDVERWTLSQSFPDPGDTTRPGLWLDKISHAGLVGTDVAVPDVEFTGTQKPNRVDTSKYDTAMSWWRLRMIRNETGGTTQVTYSEPDCAPGNLPSPATNTRLCYPVIWTPQGYSEAVTDWFNKYVVKSITETDNTGGVAPNGSAQVSYEYTYYDGAAWHYTDDDGLIKKKHKTWSSYRGYGRVGTTTGTGSERTYTETRYFRGMHGDRLSASGGTRTVTVDGINDEDWFAGVPRDSKVLNGPGGAVVSRQVNEPWSSAATATRTVNGDTVTARYNRIATVRNYTTLDGGRGERVTRTTTSFDEYGLITAVDDYGDTAVTGDEQCTKTDYLPRSTTVWLLDHPHRTQTYAVSCADSTGTLTESQVVGETRISYDNNAFETAPTRGLATRTEQMDAWNGGSPTFVQQARAAYDARGRVTSSWDAMDYLTTTAYTPALGAPVTRLTATNPLGHVTTTDLAPAWGSTTTVVDPNGKQVDTAFDGLGRITAVWQANRKKATDSANITYAYNIHNDRISSVATATLNAAKEYVTSYALYDGLARLRQEQAPSAAGGRLVTETFYDTAGRPAKTYGHYLDSTAAPGPDLVGPTEVVYPPNQTRTVYDGAGREVASIFQPYNVEWWRTSTYYGGDRVDVTPPAGGTATSAVTDVRDRTVELRQYHGASPTPYTANTWDATTYGYDPKGRLTTVTDAAGNDWTYGYDLRGRQTTTNDPDKGLTTATYDNAGHVLTSTDARGKTLAYQYDALGRKFALWDTKVGTGGTVRARWSYDTLAKGQLSQTTRIVNGSAYQVKVIAYDDMYQPIGTQIIIPTTETGLAGTYNFSSTWNVDGSLALNTVPSTNTDLSAETLTHSYTALGLPSTLTMQFSNGSEPNPLVTTTSYGAWGDLEARTLNNGGTRAVFEQYSWRLETGQLAGIKVQRSQGSPSMLADVSYSYNPAGDITKIVDAAPDPVDDTQCLSYDNLRRLTGAWTPASGNCATAPTVAGLGGPAPYWHSWTVNTVGNRLSQVVHTSAGNPETTYAYPATDQARPHALSATSGAQTGTYAYDAAGNMTSRPAPTTGAQAMTWDVEGHLETSTDSTGETRYIYDADGNRLVRRDPTGKTLYLPGEEIRYNSATATTAATRYYTHNGQTIASRTAAGLVWLAGDHQGTAQVAVDAATLVPTVRRQTPFGNPRGATTTWPNDKGFVGGTEDNTGLTHLGAREYDPDIGRFISVDPIQDLTDPQQWNAYAYANNSPVSASDPTGLMFDCDNGLCGAPVYTSTGGHGTPQGHRKMPKASSPQPKKGFWDQVSGGVTKGLEKSFVDPWVGSYNTVVGGWTTVLDDAGAVASGDMSIVDAAYDASTIFVSNYVNTVIGAVTAPVTAMGNLLETPGHLANGEYEEAAESWTEGAGTTLQLVGGFKLGSKGGGCHSFAPATLVLLADGTPRPIAAVAEGDSVVSTDPDTGQNSAQPVTDTHRTLDTDQTDLTVEDSQHQLSTLHTTQHHPFWNEDRHTWTNAGDLYPGDHLRTPDDTTTITVRAVVNHTAPAAMHDLTVNTTHTYYVLAGATPVLVHNCGNTPPGVSCNCFPATGAGPNVPPIRIEGPWTLGDIGRGAHGLRPKHLGDRPEIHHADQMPGSPIHELDQATHRGPGSQLHPNANNQGVTGAMRSEDTQLHWWYRSQEQGWGHYGPDLWYD